MNAQSDKRQCAAWSSVEVTRVDRVIGSREVARPQHPDPIRVLIVHPVMAYGECLATSIGEDPGIYVVGRTHDAGQALYTLEKLVPEVVVLDVSLPDCLALVRNSAEHVPESRILIVGVSETESEIIRYAEAGIGGYVGRNASIRQLTETIRKTARGESNCSPRIAGALLRRLSVLATQRMIKESAPPLTGREEEIVQLVAGGLSNKEIASKLGVQPSTVKNHVHNILTKLKLRRRSQVAAHMQPTGKQIGALMKV